MKIAIIFLCVALASFIDTSNGGQPLNYQNLQIDAHTRFVHSCATKLDLLGTLSGIERNTFLKCLLHEIIFQLECLALELDCSLDYLLPYSGIPANICALIKAKDLEALCLVDISHLTNCVFYLLEALFAKLGFVLFNLLGKLNSLLGYTSGLPLCLGDLHKTFEAITAYVSGCALGPLIGAVGGTITIVTSVVGTLLGVTGGLLGGKGGLLGGKGGFLI